MRLLGIDYGQKRIGLALADGGLVKPLRVIFNDAQAAEKIVRICRQEEIEKIIMGISESLKEEILSFSDKLKKRINLLIVFEDETLTTKISIVKMIMSSTKQKMRKERVDAVAAAQILEGHIKGGGNV